MFRLQSFLCLLETPSRLFECNVQPIMSPGAIEMGACCLSRSRASQSQGHFAQAVYYLALVENYCLSGDAEVISWIHLLGV